MTRLSMSTRISSLSPLLFFCLRVVYFIILWVLVKGFWRWLAFVSQEQNFLHRLELA